VRALLPAPREIIKPGFCSLSAPGTIFPPFTVQERAQVQAPGFLLSMRKKGTPVKNMLILGIFFGGCIDQKFMHHKCYRTWRKIIFNSRISNTNLAELHNAERRSLPYYKRIAQFT
jgi:hypothetical protein